jgi:protein-S-isoprenylcysteine O-methyltransferase Ste14
MSTETINMQRLIRRTSLVGIGTVIGLAALFFLPAGTFAYWQAWVYLAIVLIPMAFVAAYLLRNSPDLLQRRLQARERERTQQGVISFGIVFLVGAFLVPGFDRRWGWSTMPWWVVVAADLLVLLGYAMIFRVFRENQYTSRTVQVEQGQQVISTGPYAAVRHPMYVGVLIFYLTSPIALGSWWAFLPAAVIFPILVIRILNEEQVLERDLPGYKEYKQKVRYRLVPGIW